MVYSLTWLPGVLRAAGLKVVEQPGWKTRGHGDMGQVLGVLCHHTAGPLKGVAPSLGIVQKGRPDLPGPLAQLVLGRDGTFYVVAAGLCWHAGPGAWRGVKAGNSHFIGIEAENTGLANDNPWPAGQLDAYARGIAAILRHVGATAEMCAGHLEYALPVGRKSDPSFSVGTREARIKAMVVFRARVAALLRPAAAPAKLFDDVAPADGPGDSHVDPPDEEEEVEEAPIAPLVPSVSHGASSAEIEAVQRKLKERGYHNVGLVDGKWGGATAGAIAAFRNDRHLAGGAEINDALKAELDKAAAEDWTRPIAKERAEATAEQLAPKLPEVAAAKDAGWWAKLQAWGAGIGAALWGTGDYIRAGVDKITPIREFLPDISIGLVIIGVLVASFLIWRKTASAAAAATQAYNAGART